MWRLFCWHCKWKKTFLVVLRISSTTLLSLRSRRLEVVGAKKETREGSSSPLACLPLVYLSFLASTTSNHLLRRLYVITNYISRTQCSPYQAVINLPPEVTSYCLQVYQNLRSVKEYASELWSDPIPRSKWMNIRKITKVYTAFLLMGYAFWKERIEDRVKLLKPNILNCCIKKKGQFA